MTNTKRKNLIAIFFVTLALALIALLGSSFINRNYTARADATSHTHNVCGEAACTHEGDEHTQAVEYAPLTAAVFQGLQTTTLTSAPGLSGYDFLVIPAGNYYLAEDINIKSLENYLLVQQGVTLCLNGHTLQTTYMYVQDGTVNICDCSLEKTGVYNPSSGNYGIELGGRDTEAKTPTLNLYNGTLKGGNVIRHNNGTLNIYGGKIEASGSAVTIYGGAETNVYGGEIYTTGSYAINFSVSTNKPMTLNIYDGTITADSSTVRAIIPSTAVNAENCIMNIHVYGGKFYSDTAGWSFELASLAGYTNVINVNINGGEWFTKNTTTTHFSALYFKGWVNAKITKMKADVDDYGIFYIDPLVNLTVDPEKDEDIQLTTSNNTTLFVAIDLANKAMENAEGTTVTPADYGKVLIKGGTFTGENSNVIATQPIEQKIEISGGIFTTTSSSHYVLNIHKGVEMLVTGGSFICTSTSSKGRIYNDGILTIVGAPTFENVVAYTTKGSTDAGEYTVNLSGYTGEQKLPIVGHTADAVSQGLIFGKGSTEQMVYATGEWELVDDVDDSGNAVVKLNHVAHTGGEPTCTLTATCETCAQQYLLPHTYGEMQAEVAATCVATGTKAYQTCSVCNLHYDADGILIEDLTIAIDEDAHDIENHAAKAATCTEKGWAAYATCKREGCEHSTYQEIAAVSHDFNVRHNEEAHWEQCTRCSETKDNVAHTFTDDVCECGYENPNKGLSTGAIIAIVAGGAVVLGVGGFAIFWFVIKKKSWTDLMRAKKN